MVKVEYVFPTLTHNLLLSVFLSVSQLARGCCHPHTPSWQQFTFRIVHVNTSMCFIMSRLVRAPCDTACVLVIMSKIENTLNNPLQSHLWIHHSSDSETVSIQAQHETNKVFPSVLQVKYQKQCFAACNLVFFIIYIVQLCANSFSSSSRSPWSCFHGYQTIHLIQNRTWRVAYLQALGVRKS